MKVQITKDINELENLWPDDNHVLTPFQTYVWNKLWIKNFGLDKKLQIYTFFEETNLVGIAPLYEKNSVLQFIGTPPNISDYLDFIYLTGDLVKQRKILTEFLATVKHEKQTNINLLHLTEKSPSVKLLSKIEINFDQEQETTPFISCPASWEEYLEKLPRKKRHELKRKLKKLSSKNSQVIYFCKPEEVRQEIDVFIDLLKQSSPEKEKFMTPQKEAFFKDFSDTMAEKNLILLSFLEIEGQKVASTLMFNHRNKLYLYDSGYNPEFKEFSPSLLLTAFNMKYAIEKGFEEYDLLRGDERYKYDLGATNRYIYNVRIQLINH